MDQLQVVDDQHRKPTKPPPMTNSLFSWPATGWASYQIRKIAGLCMRWECRERFPCHQLQRKLLVCDHGMHHGMFVTQCRDCMPGLLTRDGVENVPRYISYSEQL